LDDGTEKLTPVVELEHGKCSFIAILKSGPLTISNANERLTWTLTAIVNNLLDNFVEEAPVFQNQS